MSSPLNNKPDYIFLGAGCASLSLLMRMIRSGRFADKKILLIDKEPKTKNDRTWCFWEKDKGFFEELVFNRWNDVHFLSDTFSSSLSITPYQYKMIRGVDFYNYCFGEMAKQNNVQIIYDEVRSISYHNNEVTIELSDCKINGDKSVVFNSIYTASQKKDDNIIHLLQHFKGWIIDTEQPVFNSGSATLMDFRVKQDKGTTFAYVLPFSDTRALVEYTLFSDKLLEKEAYDSELKLYISSFLKIDKYKIIDEEFGAIPMTNESFEFYKSGVYHIGTAGGQTKASSGYTFQFIQKQSQKILEYMIEGKSLHTVPVTPKRFHFYDTVLLRLLAEKKLGGDEIFTRLFQRNKAYLVFKFLDNETTLAEELRLIATLQVIPFLKAALFKN